MSFVDLSLPIGFYNSDKVDLLAELVSPLLSESVRYQRSVAYLKESFLVDAAQCIALALDNDCNYQFLIGSPLGAAELDALSQADANDADSLGARLRTMLNEADFETYPGAHLVLLQYLVAIGRLEIKLSIREDGLHHPKMRIAFDSVGNTVVTIGSDNDSRAALSGGNKETGVLFASWITHPDEWNRSAAGAIEDFGSDWRGENDNSIVLGLPEQLENQIRADWAGRGLSDQDIRSQLQSLYQKFKSSVADSSRRKKLKDHQKRAIASWIENGHQGIIAHCTGAGKTFTTTYAIEKILKQANEHKVPFAAVVAVPYVILAEQWASELQDIGFSVIRCWNSSASWHLQLSSSIVGMSNADQPAQFAVVVVNSTLRRKEFQSLVHKIPPSNLMFVADEVHRHGAESYLKQKLIPESAYKLGLSATPWSRGETEREQILTTIYGAIVDIYSLEEAIDDEILCDYYYHLRVVSLNSEEAAEYASRSRDIAALEAKKPGISQLEKDLLNNAYRLRASILASCESKFEWLDNHLTKTKPRPYSLFYAGPGNRLRNGTEDTGERLINEFSRLFDKRGWHVSKVTADDSATTRNANLRALSTKAIHCMLAIRILDEGFDMPACQEAFILASSNNERQFVQRRGRVLRQSRETDKKFAKIHDLIVTPGFKTGQVWQKTLVSNELIRAYEFAKSSLNWSDSEAEIRKLAEEWEIDFDLEVIAAVNNVRDLPDEWVSEFNISEDYQNEG